MLERLPVAAQPGCDLLVERQVGELVLTSSNGATVNGWGGREIDPGGRDRADSCGPCAGGAGSSRQRGCPRSGSDTSMAAGTPSMSAAASGGRDTTGCDYGCNNFNSEG